MLFDDTVTWRVWATKKAHQPCGQVFNQRLGEGHPDRIPRRAVVLGRMRSEPRERPAVYPVFALRATRGSSSLGPDVFIFHTWVHSSWDFTTSLTLLLVFALRAAWPAVGDVRLSRSSSSENLILYQGSPSFYTGNKAWGFARWTHGLSIPLEQLRY